MKSFKICISYCIVMSRIMRLLEHVSYSDKLKNALNALVRKPDGKRILGNVGVDGKIHWNRH